MSSALCNSKCVPSWPWHLHWDEVNCSWAIFDDLWPTRTELGDYKCPGCDSVQPTPHAYALHFNWDSHHDLFAWKILNGEFIIPDAG